MAFYCFSVNKYKLLITKFILHVISLVLIKSEFPTKKGQKNRWFFLAKRIKFVPRNAKLLLLTKNDELETSYIKFHITYHLKIP